MRFFNLSILKFYLHFYYIKIIVQHATHKFCWSIMDAGEKNISFDRDRIFIGSGEFRPLCLTSHFFPFHTHKTLQELWDHSCITRFSSFSPHPKFEIFTPLQFCFFILTSFGAFSFILERTSEFLKG